MMAQSSFGLSHPETYHLVGQHLRDLRLSRNLSVEALQAQTRVPRGFIQALESGNNELFPEDVYVHYLIVTLGKALGCAEELVHELPDAQLASVIPSWQNPAIADINKPVFLLNLFQMQIGGVMVITGLMSGCSWVLFSHLQTVAQASSPLSLQPFSVKHIYQDNQPVCTIHSNIASPELRNAIQFSC